MSEAIGSRAAVSFLAGKPAKLRAYTESSAARDVVNRRGVVGRVKHMATRLLWLQEVSAAGIRAVHPCSTLLNAADLGTKNLSASRIKLLLNLLSFRESARSWYSDSAAERLDVAQTLSIRRISKAVRKEQVRLVGRMR